jgi:hypothetical protein
MTAESRRSFRLDLDVKARPITGRLEEPDGAGHEFTGWLGLAAALEGLLSEVEQTKENDSDGA